ncbi:RNA-guided pseudouridylation complex pseudouridine synthase subunit Cbf5 [Candidatus Woesearchaeota archaeon]|nr:RNA-guided pseudouridylation complex pseudouridine synthase subunit Cbf5 [Candidatus Woesearchaeota archaeon]
MNKLPFEEIQREILVKKESSTNEAYGKRPEQRTIKELLNYGVICLNKLDGPSSHQVADYVKKILKLEKVGHGGTLDPGVTGVLPISLGKATKIMEALLKAGKEYICLMHIHSQIPQSKIHKSSKEFIGKIIQLPPVKSAVKRQLREREIYYLEILEIKNQDVLFKVGCQAGTYIRTLCVNWGKALGTNAHMQQLVRTKAGPFNDKEWSSLQDIKDSFSLYEEGNEKELRKIIKPIEFAVQHLAKICIVDSAVDTICHGANLSIPGISKLHSNIEREDLVAITSLKDELIAIGNALMTSEEIMKNEKGLVIKINKVFMEPETYPHFKKEN